MGTYINIGNAGFQSARNSEYIDKSELISIVNSTLFTEHRFSCVTRSRRFGKSLAAKMLCAYYDRTCDSRQHVLTVLIHLGYLSYNWREGECYIPNRKVAGEMVNAVKYNNWSHVAGAIEKSKQLLRATLEGDEDAVVRGIAVAHDESTSILSYNDENSLACVLSIAYYYAGNNYIVHRELPSGKDFADLVFIPRKNVDSPAIVVELKCDKSADSAIDQIRRKDHPAKVAEYADRLLLVGINYDRETKQHTCRIERL